MSNFKIGDIIKYSPGYLEDVKAHLGLFKPLTASMLSRRFKIVDIKLELSKQFNMLISIWKVLKML